jgi:chromosome segregation ATPase
LKEVEESLKAKTESVSGLEVELEKLQGSFQTALEDVQSKTTLVTELEATKATLESQLSEAQASLSGLQGNRNQEVHLLQSVKDEVSPLPRYRDASC